jgi:hypothetical protein
VGKLEDVHNSGSFSITDPDFGDGDTNVLITPDDPAILANRLGGPNTAVKEHTQIECEVNVTSDGRDQFENWLKTMLGRKVTAQGVYVDDTAHDNKSELHPLDIVVGQVDDTQTPGNWVDQIIIQHHVALGSSMLLYRFAAASDDRAGVVQEGPPLAEFERDTSVALALPPRPNGDLSLIPTGEWHLMSGTNFSVAIEPPRPEQGDIVNLVAFCEGVGFGDPGYVLGEVAAYWLNPALQLSIDHTSMTFLVNMDTGDTQTHTLQITNVGTGSVTLTVPPPPPPIPPAHVFPFSWQAIPTTTLSSGGVIDIQIEFTPLKKGTAQSALTIQSNAQGFPRRVTLIGNAIGAVNQE